MLGICHRACGVGHCCEEVAMRIQLLVVEGASRKREYKYRAILIGCKCGIAPNVAIICY